MNELAAYIAGVLLENYKIYEDNKPDLTPIDIDELTQTIEAAISRL